MNNNLIKVLIFLIKSIYYGIISLLGWVAVIIIEIPLCILGSTGDTDMLDLALKFENYYRNGVRLLFNKIIE